MLRPSPNWNARMVSCLLSPVISATGISTGMVTSAWLLPEGIKKFRMVCTTSIPILVRLSGSPASTPDRPWIMVSRISPCCMTTEMALAIPMAIAAINTDLAPSKSSSAILPLL